MIPLQKSNRFLSDSLLYLKSFVDLIFPNTCVCCGQPLVNQEEVLCLKCNIGMPRTSFHLLPNNPIEQIFWGRAKVESASSYFYYSKGSIYKNILHHLKYKNREDIGLYMGRMYGSELKNADSFSTIDCIVPIPLHPKRERNRGYNQSLAIAKGLSLSLGKEINKNSLYRRFYNNTQTKRGRFQRWENVENLFAIKNDHLLEGKHILLVDDVITTGATLEACINTLQKVPNIKISVATLAYAST